jgi:hypothetical protein
MGIGVSKPVVKVAEGAHLATPGTQLGTTICFSFADCVGFNVVEYVFVTVVKVE